MKLECVSLGLFISVPSFSHPVATLQSTSSNGDGAGGAEEVTLDDASFRRPAAHLAWPRRPPLPPKTDGVHRKDLKRRARVNMWDVARCVCYGWKKQRKKVHR